MSLFELFELLAPPGTCHTAELFGLAAHGVIYDGGQAVYPLPPLPSPKGCVVDVQRLRQGAK